MEAFAMFWPIIPILGIPLLFMLTPEGKRKSVSTALLVVAAICLIVAVTGIVNSMQ